MGAEIRNKRVVSAHDEKDFLKLQRNSELLGFKKRICFIVKSTDVILT